MRSLAARAVRSIVGASLMLTALPLVFAGTGLSLVARHRGGDEAYTAVTERVHTTGYAVVVEDIDAVLRADAPFARGGQTGLSVSVTGDGGPLFLGLAPYPAVRGYLAGTSYARVDRVRPARGPLPVDTTGVAGPGSPAGPPFAQAFWLQTSTGLTRDGRVEDALSWEPSAARGQALALVIMNADASSTVDVSLTAALVPRWLVPTMWGLLIFGGTLLLLGVVLVAWPPAATRIVYVIEPERFRRLIAEEGLINTSRDTGRPPGPEPTTSPVPSGPPAAADAPPDASAGCCGKAPGENERSYRGRRLFGDRAARRDDAAAREKTRGRGDEDADPPVVTSPRGWTVLFATPRPPATPRLLWPPKRPERSTTRPVPADAAPIDLAERSAAITTPNAQAALDSGPLVDQDAGPTAGTPPVSS